MLIWKCPTALHLACYLPNRIPVYVCGNGKGLRSHGEVSWSFEGSSCLAELNLLGLLSVFLRSPFQLPFTDLRLVDIGSIPCRQVVLGEPVEKREGYLASASKSPQHKGNDRQLKPVFKSRGTSCSVPTILAKEKDKGEGISESSI